MIIAVEDRFGIKITDADAKKIFTVGELYRLVLSSIASSNGGHCKTQHVFYRLRSSLPFQLGEKPGPDAELSHVLSKKDISPPKKNLKMMLV